MEHKKLINIRKSKGLTQCQISMKTAMEQTTYSRKERGKSPIKNEEWNRFAKALNVSIDEIKDDNNISLAKGKNSKFQKNRNNENPHMVIDQSILDVFVNYINKLEEENKKLKNKIEKLK